VSQGLAVQFLEQVDAIGDVMNLDDVSNNCLNWDSYYPTDDTFKKDDSGI
jgi:hypothetical protein